ncbi:hypothetical protein [Moraxella phage Mcat29]|nr:hypothetical protein [Moraxella phage Mcat29]
MIDIVVRFLILLTLIIDIFFILKICTQLCTHDDAIGCVKMGYFVAL